MIRRGREGRRSIEEKSELVPCLLTEVEQASNLGCWEEDKTGRERGREREKGGGCRRESMGGRESRGRERERETRLLVDTPCAVTSSKAKRKCEREREPPARR